MRGAFYGTVNDLSDVDEDLSGKFEKTDFSRTFVIICDDFVRKF